MRRPLCGRQQDKELENRRHMQGLCEESVWEKSCIGGDTNAEEPERSPPEGGHDATADG